MFGLEICGFADSSAPTVVLYRAAIPESVSPGRMEMDMAFRLLCSGFERIVVTPACQLSIR